MSKVYSWGKCKKCRYHAICAVEDELRKIQGWSGGTWAHYGLGCSMWEAK